MRGRPPLQPDPDLANRIEVLRAAGFSIREIGIAVDLDPGTLRRVYPDALEHGAARAEAKLIEAVYQAAMGGNIRAMRIWLATRGVIMPPRQRRKA